MTCACGCGAVVKPGRTWKAGHNMAQMRPIKHGTAAGYYQHRRRGLTPCEGCKTAHARSQAAWRAGRRMRQVMLPENVLGFLLMSAPPNLRRLVVDTAGVSTVERALRIVGAR